MNPQGTSVFGFKQRSKVELAHGFLWRAHQDAPGKGEVECLTSLADCTA
jgi:polyphosphate kinase 2 (PPK2 family)